MCNRLVLRFLIKEHSAVRLLQRLSWGDIVLIDTVVDYCDRKYRNYSCASCSKLCFCGGDCKSCLDDLHFHKNRIRTDYSCERMLYFYECRYSHKYCSEMIYALSNVDLSAYPRFNILSLGCGGAPDLMAFDYLGVKQPIQYIGFEINECWGKIHDFISNLYDDGTVKFYRGVDVLDFFDTHSIPRCNVICIEYLISFFYNQLGDDRLRAWFQKLVKQIVMHKLDNSPMLIIINDVDSINTGRDAFPILKEEIENLGLTVISEHKRRFKECDYYRGSVRYPSQANKFSLSEAFKDQYKVAIRCESAQLILEVM